jgi:hypothetical protein
MKYLYLMDIPAKHPEAPRLLPRIRATMRLRRLSPRTAQCYLGWILRYIRYNDTRHPASMGETEVLGFLNWLVVDGRVPHSTQMQALSALLFLYRDVLRTPLGDLRGLVRARGPARLRSCSPPRRLGPSWGSFGAAPGWWRRCCMGRACG